MDNIRQKVPEYDYGTLYDRQLNEKLIHVINDERITHEIIKELTNMNEDTKDTSEMVSAWAKKSRIPKSRNHCFRLS